MEAELEAGFEADLEFAVSVGAKKLNDAFAPAANIKGNCVGLDKIGHFFNTGFLYYQLEKDVLKTDPTAPAADYVEAFGYWSEGLDYTKHMKADDKITKWLYKSSVDVWLDGNPRGKSRLVLGSFFGHYASHGFADKGASLADMAADRKGNQFWKDMKAIFDMGLALKKAKDFAGLNKWLANDLVSFDIGRYVAQDWDETKTPNIKEESKPALK